MIIYTIVSEMHGHRNIKINKLLLNVEGIMKATDKYQLCCVCDVISFINCECVAIRLTWLKFKHTPCSRSCKHAVVLETFSLPDVPTLI